MVEFFDNRHLQNRLAFLIFSWYYEENLRVALIHEYFIRVSRIIHDTFIRVKGYFEKRRTLCLHFQRE